MPVRILKDVDIINGEVVPITIAFENLAPVQQSTNGTTSANTSTTITPNSQGSSNTVITVVQNQPETKPANGGQTVGANLNGNTYNTQGAASSGGGINNQSTKITSDEKYPNIYLNIKENTFSNNSLFFRLDTDSLSSATAGDTFNTWSDSSGVSNLILTGSAGCLKCASAYGLKFYQLSANQAVANASYAMSPTTYPTYTILVFALANDNGSSLIYGTNSVHKFVASNLSNSNLDFINFSPVKNADGNVCRFSLNASTLNDASYLLNIQPRFNTEILALTPSQATPDFFANYDQWLTQTGGFIGLSTGKSQGFGNQTSIKNEICNLSNLYNLRTNLATPDASVSVSVNTGSVKNYTNFSLFFVEMYTYMDGTIANTNQYGSQYQNYPFYNLKYETLVNGVPAFSASMAFDQKATLPSSSNYNISLSNKYFGTSSGSRADMFLFNYIQGGGRTVSEMKNNSKKAIESLAFKYRNLLLKSTSDLQITNSTTSLAFPPDLSHPFTNFYAVNK
jgi:hypothetical protein